MNEKVDPVKEAQSFIDMLYMKTISVGYLLSDLRMDMKHEPISPGKFMRLEDFEIEPVDIPSDPLPDGLFGSGIKYRTIHDVMENLKKKTLKDDESSPLSEWMRGCSEGDIIKVMTGGDGSLMFMNQRTGKFFKP
jgi:hypothetical protein